MRGSSVPVLPGVYLCVVVYIYSFLYAARHVSGNVSREGSAPSGSCLLREKVEQYHDIQVVSSANFCFSCGVTSERFMAVDVDGAQRQPLQ